MTNPTITIDEAITLINQRIESCDQHHDARFYVEEARAIADLLRGMWDDLLGYIDRELKSFPANTPKGLDPTFYHTLSYEGDMAVRAQLLHKRALLNGKPTGGELEK